MNQDDLPVDVVMQRRFELVEQKALIEGRHKAELEPLNEEINLCEKYIQQHMLQNNMQSCKTAAGQAFFKTGDSATVEDFETFIGSAVVNVPPPEGVTPEQWGPTILHIMEHGNWHMLKKDVSKTAVKEYIETNNVVPPGIKYDSFRKLNWMRGKG